MNKLKEIRSVEELKEFIYLHRDLLKKAALPVTVAAAVLFFWIFGMGHDRAIEERNVEGDESIAGENYESGVSSEELSAESENSVGQTQNTEDSRIYVDISGCVENPGVYEVETGTRLFQLIEKAGGLTAEADIEGINRAETVADGQKIVIYKKGDDSQNSGQNGSISSNAAQTADGKININTADENLLQDSPGVGPVTADSIVQYREEKGRFSSIEEIKNVSGIGDKTFEKLKDYITV